MRRWVRLLVVVSFAASCTSSPEAAETTDGSVGTTTVTTTQTITPVRVEQADDGVWSVYEFDVLEPRLGMGAVITDGDYLFLWGGAREGVGTLYNDGALIDLSTGSVSIVSPAPLDPRLFVSVVWTGAEFIVFGGQDFAFGAFADGAAYDPATMTWRLLPEAPVTAASHATATFVSGAMYVWLPSYNAPYGGIPRESFGQFARYRPDTDTWDLLPSPPELGHTARLLGLGGEPLLVMGPQLLDYGTPTARRWGITAIAFDSDRDLWLTPVTGRHAADAAAAVVMEGSVVVLLVDGTVITLSDDAWTQTASIAPDCPLSINAAAGADRAYFVLCGAMHVGQHGDIRFLPLPESLTDPERPLILCCGGVLEATHDGSLVVLGWEGPAGTGQPFEVNILVIYSPR